MFKGYQMKNAAQHPKERETGSYYQAKSELLNAALN